MRPRIISKYDDTITVGFCITKKQHREIHAQAKREGITASDILRRLVEAEFPAPKRKVKRGIQ